MATTETQKHAKPATPPPATGTNGPTAASTPTASGANASSRFTKIETERYMYNPNKGCDTPLVGFILNMIAMPPMQMGGQMREWNCFLFKLTEPCKVINREGNVIVAPVGAEVLTPATHQLTQFMERPSTRQDVCFEVQVAPSKKLDIGKGQTMWLYDLGINMNGTPRKQFGPSAMLGGPSQLSGGQAAAELAGTVGADNIPF
jgi:hypothetical protein